MRSPVERMWESIKIITIFFNITVIMAKIVENDKGFKVIRMNNTEAAKLGFGIVPGTCIWWTLLYCSVEWCNVWNLL